MKGIPGCGKTFLCSSVIDSIQADYRNRRGTSIAYYFFDLQEQAKREPSGLLRSLLQQPATTHEDASAHICALYDACRMGNAKPTTEQLLETLRSVFRDIPQTYVMIDALDECSELKELLTIL